MIMKNKYIFLLFLSVFGVFVFSPLEAVAKKKKKGMPAASILLFH